MSRLLLIPLLAALAAGCGNKGDLVKPTPPPAQQPAAQPATPPGDAATH